MPSDGYQDWQEFIDKTMISMPDVISQFEGTYFPPTYSTLESCSRCGVRVYASKQKQHDQWHWALSLLFFTMTARMERIDNDRATHDRGSSDTSEV